MFLSKVSDGRLDRQTFLFNRLRLNIALTYQNMSYCDSETKENVETQKRKQRGKTTGRGQRQLKREKAVNLSLVSSLQPVRLEWSYQEQESSSRLSLQDQRSTQAPLD